MTIYHTKDDTLMFLVFSVNPSKLFTDQSESFKYIDDQKSFRSIPELKCWRIDGSIFWKGRVTLGLLFGKQHLDLQVLL